MKNSTSLRSRATTSGNSSRTQRRRKSASVPRAILLPYCSQKGIAGAGGWRDCRTRGCQNKCACPAVARKSRFEMLLGTKEHEMHHRGQLMVIERGSASFLIRPEIGGGRAKLRRKGPLSNPWAGQTGQRSGIKEDIMDPIPCLSHSCWPRLLRPPPSRVLYQPNSRIETHSRTC